MQKRWRHFLKDIRDDAIGLFVVIADIQTFLEPEFDAVVSEKEWQKNWTPRKEWSDSTKEELLNE